MTDQVNEAVADRLCAIANEIYSAWEHDNDSRVGKMLRALADPAFASQYRADIADLHASLNAPHPSRGVVDERRLIGWRTGDHLHETADHDVARSWIGNVEVLPIFEGDPNTKLQAAALPAVPEGYVLVRRDSIERAAQMAEVFDDGSDGADAETAARVAHDLRGWLITATPAHDQPEGEG